MADILHAYPTAKIALFIRYHIGGCASCSYQLTDTLAEVRRNYNITDSLEAVLAAVRQSASVEAKIHISPEQACQRTPAGRGPAASRYEINQRMAGRPPRGCAADHGGIDLQRARFLV